MKLYFYLEFTYMCDCIVTLAKREKERKVKVSWDTENETKSYSLIFLELSKINSILFSCSEMDWKISLSVKYEATASSEFKWLSIKMLGTAILALSEYI